MFAKEASVSHIRPILSFQKIEKMNLLKINLKFSVHIYFYIVTITSFSQYGVCPSCGKAMFNSRMPSSKDTASSETLS